MRLREALVSTKGGMKIRLSPKIPSARFKTLAALPVATASRWPAAWSEAIRVDCASKRQLVVGGQKW